MAAEKKSLNEISSKKVLFVFDFDHSLIDSNTDIWIMNMAPHLNLESRLREIRKKFPKWTDLMNYVTKLLHENGCSQEDYVHCLNQLEIIQPMKQVLEKIRDHPLADAVIASDANTFFIDTILAKDNLTSVFTAIYSNPAHFDETGCLIRSNYHSHSCQICHRSPNMCKGEIIDQLTPHYSKVVYVGDGFNDYCPAMHLTSQDHVIARKGYGLVKRINMEIPPPPPVYVLDFTDNETASLLINLLPPIDQ